MKDELLVTTIWMSMIAMVLIKCFGLSLGLTFTAFMIIGLILISLGYKLIKRLITRG